MRAKPPDDIGVLCRRVGMDRDNYRVFTAPRRAGALPGPGMPAWEGSAPAHAEVRPEPPPPRRTALIAALGEAVRSAGPQVAPRPAAPALDLYSAGGGAGTTTVLASLARAFSRAGERVAVVDRDAMSALPLYFGGRSLRGGYCTFFASYHTAAAIHLVAREGRDAGEEPRAGGEWYGGALRKLEGEVDRILLDAAPGDTESGTGPGLLLVTPDLASIMRARQFTRVAASAPYVLLSRFEPRFPLHEEIRAMLAGQFGPRLLPFAVRRSEQFAEALAEGVTVLEYAPGGAAAEDILRLADWVRTAR